MSLDSRAHDDDRPPRRSTNHPVGNRYLTTSPRKGRLVALRTKAEVENSNPQTRSAHVVEIPQKSGNEVLKAVDALIHAHGTEATNLQHLRRIIKPDHLPVHLKPTISSESSHATLYLLVCPTNSLPISALCSLFASLLPSPHPPTILGADIPLYPPASSLQAAEWSEKYWPTVYRRYHPFGPQPSLVTIAEMELRNHVGVFMSLALQAGKEVEEQGLGVGVGAVVAEKGEVVAVAGDGRWVGDMFGPQAGGHREGGNGNPMAHSVMRAIGLVARKRRQLLSQHSLPVPERAEALRKQETSTAQREEENHSADVPLTNVERDVCDQDSLKPGGYLCLDLDMYITHEPCVMCSMAILHSRFGRVIFGQPMPKTGGMSAEVKGDSSVADSGEGNVAGTRRGLGYGLCWRQELNWRLLGWQWEDQDTGGYGTLKGETHV